MAQSICERRGHLMTAPYPNGDGFYRSCYHCGLVQRSESAETFAVDEVRGTLRRYSPRLFRLMEPRHISRFLGIPRHLMTLLHSWRDDSAMVFVPDETPRPPRYFC